MPGPTKAPLAVTSTRSMSFLRASMRSLSRFVWCSRFFFVCRRLGGGVSGRRRARRNRGRGAGVADASLSSTGFSSFTFSLKPPPAPSFMTFFTALDS